MSQQESERLLTFFSHHLENSAIIIYEPIRPNDAFGKMMTSNLAARRIHMPSLQRYPTPVDQESRLRSYFSQIQEVNSKTIDAIWDDWVMPEEKQRLDHLEGLDEVEEWKLLASHYLVVWGSKGTGWGSWKRLNEEAASHGRASAS